MRINGFDPKIYGANLLSYTVGGCGLTDTYFLPPATIVPVKLGNKLKLRKITLKFDFEAEDTHEATKNMSNLTAILRNEAELLLPDGFYYHCILTDIGDAESKSSWIEQTVFNLVGYRHGPMICETITETSNIFVQGNYDAEAIFVVDTEESSITINDITVKNISGEIVIDGFDKLVQQDGTNKFIDCDMTDFPILTPGVNTITVSGAATVTVKYYPIYV